MTFGFALVLAGFILLDAGWNGTTPVAVLKGLTAGKKGAGGVLKETGEDVMNSVSGAPSTSRLGGNGVPPLPQIGGLKGKKKALTKQFPDLKPGILAVLTIVLAAFPGLSVSSPYRPGDDGHHGEGRAVDLVGSQSEMERASKWINKFLVSALTEGIHNPSLSIDNKKYVDPSFWGSETWSGHIDHIHLAV